MTQGSDGYGIPADVNPNLIARDTGRGEDADDDYDDGDAAERRHAEDARQRAQAGINFRATQGPQRETSDAEYDDAELDELFRQTVMPGLSTPRKGREAYTPTSNGSSRTDARSGASVTPTSMGRQLQARRADREERMRREAGLGDLR
jgi:DNA polymerase zeta